MLLAGKKILVTGVLNDDSIAFSVAKRLLEEGAEIVLAAIPDRRALVERTAKRLPLKKGESLDILNLDVNYPEFIRNVRDHLERKWGKLDGFVHSIAFAPRDALGGSFSQASYESVEIALRTSAYSLCALATGLSGLMVGHRSSVVTMTFESRFAFGGYNWMGVAKAALESIGKYLAREYGPSQVRFNFVSAGPTRTLAARSIPDFEKFTRDWPRLAPLGWNLENQEGIADVVLFLLSDYSRLVTGEIIHADGGAHAVQGLVRE